VCSYLLRHWMRRSIKLAAMQSCEGGLYIIKNLMPFLLPMQSKHTISMSSNFVSIVTGANLHRLLTNTQTPPPVPVLRSLQIILYLAQGSNSPLGTSQCNHVSDINTMSKLITYNTWCNSLSLFSMLRALSKQQLRLTAAS